METKEKTVVTVRATINASIEKVWNLWTMPEHIMKWNNASDDWHTPFAENDLRSGGKFLSRMEPKDSSGGFDFFGTYEAVKTHELIEYVLGDGRRVKIIFFYSETETEIVESFETETEYTVELQKNGWQAILDNFKRYAEAYN